MQNTLMKPASTFQVSAKGSDLLKSIEQRRLEPYDDQTGDAVSSWVKGATIGYGHLIAGDDWNKYVNGITQEQADTLFMQDLEPFANAVRSKVTAEITQNQFDALVIFVFNIDVGGFSTSSALKLVNDPAAVTAYPDLEAAWKAWNKSQGKVMQGLVNRRNAEWDIYSENIYQRG